MEPNPFEVEARKSLENADSERCYYCGAEPFCVCYCRQAYGIAYRQLAAANAEIERLKDGFAGLQHAYTRRGEYADDLKRARDAALARAAEAEKERDKALGGQEGIFAELQVNERRVELLRTLVGELVEIDAALNATEVGSSNLPSGKL